MGHNKVIIIRLLIEELLAICGIHCNMSFRMNFCIIIWNLFSCCCVGRAFWMTTSRHTIDKEPYRRKWCEAIINDKVRKLVQDNNTNQKRYRRSNVPLCSSLCSCSILMFLVYWATTEMIGLLHYTTYALYIMTR